MLSRVQLFIANLQIRIIGKWPTAVTCGPGKRCGYRIGTHSGQLKKANRNDRRFVTIRIDKVLEVSHYLVPPEMVAILGRRIGYVPSRLALGMALS